MKVRGISMLLQDFRQEAGPPLDSDEAWLGVGLVLESCARTMLRALSQIEELEIKRAKSGKTRLEDIV